VTPERTTKVKLKELADSYGDKVFRIPIINGGMGLRGVPDEIWCVNGRFLGLEVKAGSNRPTKLQALRLKQIEEAGGVSLIINETNTRPDEMNINGLKQFINLILAGNHGKLI
jgi:hypothetical protein